jgi:two-component system, cell cycle sensor histidine kinase and response regulator CckA
MGQRSTQGITVKAAVGKTILYVRTVICLLRFSPSAADTSPWILYDVNARRFPGIKKPSNWLRTESNWRKLDSPRPRCAFALAGAKSSSQMPQRAAFTPGSLIGQEQVTTLLNSTRELIAIVSPQGIISFANAAFTQAISHCAENLVGKPIVSIFHPSDAGGLQECLHDLPATGGRTFGSRCRLQCKDGSCRSFEGQARDYTNVSGIEGIVLTFQDVTDLQRMEEERQVISEIVQALNQTANLDQLLHGIHQALKKVVYAENCFVALHNQEADAFTFPFFADQVDTAPAPQKVGRSCTAFVFRKGSPMLIPQGEFDRLAALGEVELVGSPSPSWLGVPLKTPRATIGVLVVQHYENESAYDTRDLEFLSSVGGHIALAIERRRSEDALRKNEEMFRLLFSYNPLPTWVIDKETRRFLEVNDAAVRQYGYSLSEFKSMTVLDLRPEEERARYLDLTKQLPSDGLYHGNWKHRKKDGKIVDVETISHELEYEGRRVRLVVAQDLSERHLLEQQLRQSQKMEAVGRLAGGVAHDFNNLLMVIKGHTELLLNSLPPSEQYSRRIEQIDRAADRASSLTRQLLAFSRLQVLQPRVMSLNEVVEEMGRLLPRLIGEDIELVIRSSQDLGAIRADASQMEQIVMNLAVNARDAMPEGGRLLIETSNVELDSNYSAIHPIVRQGRYVLLAVSDNGTGMDAETQAHIFEPFFTTKPQGKGTGLGLATVYGIVKQSGGFIWVYSEVGRGTSFKVYLPRVDQPFERIGPVRTASEAPRGMGTILLAEDEQDVREVAREFLESGGYTVIEARDGAEALKKVEAHTGGIDLLVTDMVMPGMTGQELRARLQGSHPEIRVLYMSGYSERAAADAARGDSSMHLLAKPFSRWALLRAIHEILKHS